jgi:tRNA1Val (adenine37-N6)-methyltransferase
MKVSTDSCILGAYTPVPQQGNILDIGTGTGLLALMIAQRCACEIDAVEQDEESFLQAAENINHSLWKHRIHPFHSDIRSFSSVKKYNLIICNPPFFERHLKSVSVQTNKAKHADGLSLNDLIEVVTKFLNKQSGKLSILLPVKQSELFNVLAAKNDLQEERYLLIRDKVSRPVIRVISIYSHHKKTGKIREQLTIKDQYGKYTDEFTALLKTILSLSVI